MGKCLWEDLTWNSKVLDMMLLSEAKAKGIILPSKHYGEEYIEEVEFEGAYRRADLGRFENLYKLDLSSAYPMAIIELCLDIANLTQNKNEQKIDITDRETNEVKYSVYFKQNSNALLPTLARKLIIKKDYIKKQLKELDPESPEGKDLQIKYDAVKSLVNSLFGVTALKIFRLYNVNIASSITSIIRDLLHYVEENLKENGAEVIYLDTDSVFIKSTDLGLDILSLCNNLVKQWIKEKFNKNNTGIEFDLEGIFEQILIVALCHYKGRLRKPDGKLKNETKGIEAKRKDSSKFMQKFQTALIDKILDNEPQEDIIWFINQQKLAIKLVPLTDIGFPCKINNTKDYKSIPIFVRALEYSKELFGFTKVAGDTFYYIYVEPFGKAIRKASRNMKNKETGVKEIKTSEKEINKNVLAYDDEQFDHIKNIDWKKMIDRTIIDKCEHIFTALSWDLSLIKEVKVKKIKKND
jgi:DNA polymerase elongation subunit (family B)